MFTQHSRSEACAPYADALAAHALAQRPWLRMNVPGLAAAPMCDQIGAQGRRAVLGDHFAEFTDIAATPGGHALGAADPEAQTLRIVTPAERGPLHAKALL